MKHYTIRIPCHLWAHIIVEDENGITNEEIMADLYSTYGYSIDRVVGDIIEDYEIIEESEAG